MCLHPWKSDDKIKIAELETKVAAHEARIEVLERIIKCIQEKEEDNNKDADTNNANISAVTESPEKVDENVNYENEQTFECEICEFRSIRENGLEIHMGRVHKNIEQIDGHMEENEDDELLDSTERYWRTGILGSCYQTYLDVMALIDDSYLDDEAKKTEHAAVALDSRKEAFGEQYIYYPPWRKFPWFYTILYLNNPFLCG